MAPPREHAGLLLRKAAQDEFVFHRLADDPDCPDEVLGFHAQQAIEKMLKAALSLRRIPFRRTHDLAALILLLEDSSTPLPESMHDVSKLTSYAADFRYEESGSTGLDRAETRRLVLAVRRWAESLPSA